MTFDALLARVGLPSGSRAVSAIAALFRDTGWEIAGHSVRHSGVMAEFIVRDSVSEQNPADLLPEGKLVDTNESMAVFHFEDGGVVWVCKGYSDSLHFSVCAIRMSLVDHLRQTAAFQEFESYGEDLREDGALILTFGQVTRDWAPSFPMIPLGMDTLFSHTSGDDDSSDTWVVGFYPDPNGPDGPDGRVVVFHAAFPEYCDEDFDGDLSARIVRGTREDAVSVADSLMSNTTANAVSVVRDILSKSPVAAYEMVAQIGVEIGDESLIEFARQQQQATH